MPLPRGRVGVKLKLLWVQRQEEARFQMTAAKMRVDNIQRETALLEEEESVKDSHISGSRDSKLRHYFRDLDGEHGDAFIVEGRGRLVPPVPKPRSILSHRKFPSLLEWGILPPLFRQLKELPQLRMQSSSHVTVVPKNYII